MVGRRVRAKVGDIPAELTSFVGREREIRAVCALLDTAIAVTLVGPGGVGKTRLAQRVVSQLRRDHPRATMRWVNLSVLERSATAEAVAREVAESCGVPSLSQHSAYQVWRDRLRDERRAGQGTREPFLLVLDNCEHVLEPVGALASDLLATVVGIRVLATSREPLGCYGEYLSLVPPLSVSPLCSSIGAAAAQSEAMELFIQRAEAAGLRIAENDRATASSLCQRLDGIPLAVELAAASLRTHSLHEIATGLDGGPAGGRFELLTRGPRHGSHPMHHSLRSAVDWSFRLCSAAEQVLWGRLSVFEDGWDQAAAQSVCGADDVAQVDIPQLISGLVAKSVVIAERVGAHTRYRFLETLKAYGRAVLHERGEQEQLRRRHRDYYLTLVSQAALDWYSARELSWLEKVRTELANIRAALHWSLRTPGEQPHALDLATKLARLRVQFFLGNLSEALEWLELCLASTLGNGACELRLTALMHAGWTAMTLGDEQRATSLLHEARELSALDASPPPEIMFLESAFAFFAHDEQHSVDMFRRTQEAFARTGPRYAGEAHQAGLFYAMAAAWHAGPDEALEASGRRLELDRACGAQWATSWAMLVRSLALMWHAEPREALALGREAIGRHRDMDDKWGLIWSTHIIAWACAEALDKRPEHGQNCLAEAIYIARLIGAAQMLREQTRVALVGLPSFSRANARAEAVTRRFLDAPTYTFAVNSGYKLSPVLVTALALGEYDATGVDSTGFDWNEYVSPEWLSLTMTEREIAELVARGMSNSEIARQRVSSVRTIEKHVENILRKLHADSRGAIRDHLPVRK